MVANSVAERIISNIKTTLEAIHVDAGYSFTMAQVLREDEVGFGGGLQVYPGAIISHPEQSIKVVGPSIIDYRMMLTVEAWLTATGENKCPLLVELETDIIHAMLVDPGRGGHAKDTLPISTRGVSIGDDQMLGGVWVRFDIPYRHNRTGPGVPI